MIVKCPLLRIDERVIGQRQQRKLARRLFRTAVDVGVAFAGELPICRFDFGGCRRRLYAQDLVIIRHYKGNVRKFSRPKTPASGGRILASSREDERCYWQCCSVKTWHR